MMLDIEKAYQRTQAETISELMHSESAISFYTAEYYA